MTEFKTKRLVVLVEPGRLARIKKLAQRDEFRVNGEPSNAAVVRAALDLFFANYGLESDHLVTESSSQAA